ncbi:hypothetical protein LTR66_001575 [Elasticomyces elasticus]|nr:hypothetical protein LTR66_001575 [Elasticomyces elasticus]
MAQEATRAYRPQPRPLYPAKAINTPSGTVGLPAQHDSRAEHDQTTPVDAMDEVTAAFVRRTLCARQLHANTITAGDKGAITPRPLDELLPPLTSSNAVDLELYAIIAIIIKDFVQSWYTRITSDHDFTDEVIQVIAHCTRGLEQRLREVNLEVLVLDEIPQILQSHMQAYYTSRDLQGNCLQGLEFREIYHTLRPHPALSPAPDPHRPGSSEEQQENEAVWRQLLVQGILTLLLPPEDLENPCLKVLVSEIFSELVLGSGVGGKACEGWTIWEGCTKLLGIVGKRDGQALASEPVPPQPLNRLEQFGLLSMRQAAPVNSLTSSNETWDAFARTFWQVMQHLSVVSTAIYAIITALLAATSLPPRTQPDRHSRSGRHAIQHSIADDRSESMPKTEADAAAPPNVRPILDMSLWSCSSRFLCLDFRMPWFSGFLALTRHSLLFGPGKVGGTNGSLDRLLAHIIHSRILNPAILPLLIRTFRTSLFPNYTLGPARVPPTPDEATEIRLRCADAIVRAMPAFVRSRFFATEDEGRMRDDAAAMLMVFDDSYLNKHFVFALVELVVTRLFPEMEERGVTELLAERQADLM